MVPGFWLATLNPGKKVKKHRRGRRLGMKRDALGKFLKRKVRSARRKATLKRVRTRRRVSAHVTGRLAMARKVKRHRRAKRNSWFGAPRRHAKASRLGWRRRRKAKRNPLWRTRFGQFSGSHAKRRLRRLKGQFGGWRNNTSSVLPISWNSWPDNAKGHARAARLGWRRRHAKRSRKARRYAANPRRRYKRNAVLPVSWNAMPMSFRRPRRHYRRNAALTLPAVLEPVEDFMSVDFWTGTALPATAGFLGTKTLGRLAYDYLPAAIKPANATADQFVKIGINAVTAAALSWGVGAFVDKRMAKPIFIGGVVAVTFDLLKALLPANWASTIGLSGLGADELSDAMRKAVAQRVRQELSGVGGVGSFLNYNDVRRQMAGVGEFMTDAAMRSQPGYSALPSGSLADYDPLSESSVI